MKLFDFIYFLIQYARKYIIQKYRNIEFRNIEQKVLYTKVLNYYKKNTRLDIKKILDINILK